MFAHYRTQGFFLKKEDRGEANQLLTIFTEDFGKLEVLGRAIRKIKSKLRAGAELFLISEIEFIQGKTYKTLTDTILIKKFKNISEDFQKLTLAYEIARNLDIFLGREEKDEEVWKLLKETFQKLNNQKVSQNSLEIIYYFFLWNFLSLLGYGVELYSCPICQRKLKPEIFWFLSKEGGILCSECLKDIKKEEKKGVERININTVKVLRIIMDGNWNILKRLKIEKEDKKNLKEISHLYLSFLKKEFSKEKI